MSLKPERDELLINRQILAICLFSFFVNALMLTGPLFMLQIYDRVLSSRSEATLVALLILVVFLYTAMGVLDFVRGRIGARIGAEIQTLKDGNVFSASLRARDSMKQESMTALSDIEIVRRFFSSPVFFAMFDAPFTPLFIAAIYLFHPLLGWLALGSAVLLLTISLSNQIVSNRSTQVVAQAAASASRFGEMIRMQPETIRSLGMTQAVVGRWSERRQKALAADLSLADVNGGFGSLTKALRLFLQSAMLALGAWLVLKDQLTAGAMIAASILLGRALAPIEQIIGGWSLIARARTGWASVKRLMETEAPPPERTRLNKPRAHLTAKNVNVCAPGQRSPILTGLNFEVSPGTAIGVVGESASGKSTLARILTGLWTPQSGTVRLDGATLDQYGEEGLAEHVGYLPQEVVLFEGTVAENISRMSDNADSKAIIAAAQRAGAHDMILRLHDGYDSRVGGDGISLSGGQKQRIGLARAMYGDPVVLVLDEPNSNLDVPGSNALNAAIRDMKQNGYIVIVMAHRPAAIVECDLIMLIRDGRIGAFGPRDEILRGIVQKQTKLSPTENTPQEAGDG